MITSLWVESTFYPILYETETWLERGQRLPPNSTFSHWKKQDSQPRNLALASGLLTALIASSRSLILPKKGVLGLIRWRLKNLRILEKCSRNTCDVTVHSNHRKDGKTTHLKGCFFFGLVCSTEEMREFWVWKMSWSRKQRVAECQSWSRRAGVGWICDWSSLLRVQEITRGFVWGQEQTGMPSGYLCACGTWGTLRGWLSREADGRGSGGNHPWTDDERAQVIVVEETLSSSLQALLAGRVMKLTQGRLVGQKQT